MPSRLIGRHLVRLESVTSTNDVAFELAERGALEGTVVLADAQSQGRGRHGRAWHAAPHTSVLLSAIFRPLPSCQKATLLTALAAVAAYETVASHSALEPLIKWPNDVYLRGRKICGILIEQRRGVWVVGIGINVNQTEDELQSAGLSEATSLRAARDRKFSTEAVAADLMQHLDNLYHELLDGSHDHVLEKWVKAMRILGTQVKVGHSDGETAGLLVAIDFETLRLENMPGRVASFNLSHVQMIQPIV